jgi:eukaryotic-like serine/threonine-protein kinase
VSRFERRGAFRDAQMLRIQLALVQGDFAGAEKSTRALLEQIKDQSNRGTQSNVTRLLVELLWETGRERDAGEETSAFLARRGVLLSHPEENAWNDETMLFWRSELLVGHLSRSQYEEQRRRWQEPWGNTLPDQMQALWFMGYALPAISPEDAEEALRVSPVLWAPDDYRRLAPEKVLAAYLEGKVRVLAGDAAGALPALVLGASDCGALSDPMRHTHANFYLGKAREATGDIHGACAAYGVVLERWGSSPLSRTGAEASERSRVLRCHGRARHSLRRVEPLDL